MKLILLLLTVSIANALYANDLNREFECHIGEYTVYVDRSLVKPVAAIVVTKDQLGIVHNEFYRIEVTENQHAKLWSYTPFDSSNTLQGVVGIVILKSETNNAIAALSLELKNNVFLDESGVECTPY